MRTFDERLAPPWWLWVLGAVFVFLLALSFYVVLGPLAAGAVVLVLGGVVGWVLGNASATVRVEDDTLFAGRAHIPVWALGPVEVLDAERARAVRGPESDPAGYHLIRGWLPTGIRVPVVDPQDATPYWFVATRRPQELAAAIEAARSATA